ncbi:5'/3'-nucleotidase SurE, partial [Hyphomicrobium sp.]|uniref:5'/3'-nucleotidase SurE n=1 Tax=Hyphomicrobium sp. TaxID=82 RepID=UPI002D776668
IALSLMMGFEEGARRAIWETPLAHAPSLIRKLLDEKWAPKSLININFPDADPEVIKGVAVTTQGVRDQALLDIDSRIDPWGTPYFWFGFERRKSMLIPGTDLAAIAENKISVTPLSIDLTNHGALKALSGRLS